MRLAGETDSAWVGSAKVCRPSMALRAGRRLVGWLFSDSDGHRQSVRLLAAAKRAVATSGPA